MPVAEEPTAFPKGVDALDGTHVAVTYHKAMGGHGPVYTLGYALGVCLACGLVTDKLGRFQLAACESHTYKDGRTGALGGPHKGDRKTHGRGR